MPVQPRFYNWILLVALCVGLIGITGLSFFSSRNAAVPAKTITDFTFTDIDGHTANLSDYRGKIVLLHFWASWCLPCEKEFPSLIDAVQGNADIILLAVSVDNNKPAMQKFLLAQNATGHERIHAIWDQDKKISQGLFRIMQYPETLVLNRDQTLFKHVIGTANWSRFRLPAR